MKPFLISFVVGTLLVMPAWAGVADKFFHEERGFWTVRDRNDTSWPAPENGARTNLMVARIHDDESNVTCWVVSGSARGGISCLPDVQLHVPTRGSP